MSVQLPGPHIHEVKALPNHFGVSTYPQQMKYIDQLKDDSVKDIFIDILNNQLIVKVENLPQYKLDLIQSLLNQERVIINDVNLIKNNNMFFGSLIIKYDA